MTKQDQIKNYNTSKQENDTKDDTKKPSEDDTKTEEQKIISKQADNTSEKRKQDKEEAERERKEEQRIKDEQDTLNKLGNKIAEGQEAIANSVSPFTQWLAKQPTPGGVATIFVILMFFLFAIVPVNERGDTRLKLIWFTLTSKTKLSSDDTGDIIGGGGDFGNTITSTPTQTTIPITTTPIGPTGPKLSIAPQPTNGNGFIPLATTDLLNLFNFGE